MDVRPTSTGRLPTRSRRTTTEPCAATVPWSRYECPAPAAVGADVMDATPACAPAKLGGRTSEDGGGTAAPGTGRPAAASGASSARSTPVPTDDSVRENFIASPFLSQSFSGWL